MRIRHFPDMVQAGIGGLSFSHEAACRIAIAPEDVHVLESAA